MLSDTKKQDPKSKKSDLEKRIDQLESIIIKMASYTGQNRILIEMGLPTYEVGKADMNKFKNVAVSN